MKEAPRLRVFCVDAGYEAGVHRLGIEAYVDAGQLTFSRLHYAARLNTRAIAPTRMRLTAQDVSRLNQLRDTNFRPR
jgi:hypothetical protein